MKLLIADDEIDVRSGIRFFVNWEELGIDICGEGKNGADALEKILQLRPDIVLLDIRMPRLSGLEVIRQAKEKGFAGKFIILSGYSDFSYAQQAVRYDVNFYLTKPIDEEELKDAVQKTMTELAEERAAQKKMIQYRSKARNMLIQDLICRGTELTEDEIQELCMEATVYQIVICVAYNRKIVQKTWDFAEILRLVNHNHNVLESIVIDGQNVILLKGEMARERFDNVLEHYQKKIQKGSPLDMMFLAYGEPVSTIGEIPDSYETAERLMAQRFFSKKGQHVIGYRDFMKKSAKTIQIASIVDIYPQRLANYIQTGGCEMVRTSLEELAEDLRYTACKEESIRHHLADIMIEVKLLLSNIYMGTELSLLNNISVINSIEEKSYLYEIMDFFMEQFEIYMKAIGTPDRKRTMSSILYYIQHNYQKNLKLSALAELFGYNSSYLGQVFSKETGQTFNSYLDKVRIDAAKRLLEDGNYKVYEVSDMVGYTNVDYFHKKFKKHVGMSPKEYHKN